MGEGSASLGRFKRPPTGARALRAGGGLWTAGFNRERPLEGLGNLLQQLRPARSTFCCVVVAAP